MVEQQGTAVPVPPAPFHRLPKGRWLFERWIGLQLWGLFVVMAPIGIFREALRRPRVLLSFAECRDVAFGAAWAIVGPENAKSNAEVKRRLLGNVRRPRPDSADSQARGVTLDIGPGAGDQLKVRER